MPDAYLHLKAWHSI